MSKGVDYSVTDGVAVLAIHNPPVNALNAVVRRALVEALDQALDDANVRAIVILGKGRTFPAGADIAEFDKPLRPPHAAEVNNRIETSPKPVIAALHGSVLGGGFELALAAHYRIATTTTRIGFPEVTLGVLPGAGGTQRSARLAGAQEALDLMLSGRPMAVTAPRAASYIDRVVDGDLRQAALDYAQDLMAKGAPVRPTRDAMQGMADPVAYQHAVASRRAALAGHPEIAPHKIVECVEAAELLPFEQGLAFESAAFADCVESDQAAALRHLFFAERRAPKFPEMAKGRVGPVRRVGVVGSGQQGSGVVLACLGTGVEVVLVERNETILNNRMDHIRKVLGRQVSRGKLSEKARVRYLENLTGKSDLVALSDVDMVIEAVPENLDEKRRVFAQLDGIVPEGAILASTSLRVDIDALAAATDDPAQVIGLRFSRPVRLARLVEVVVGPRSGADAVATVVGYLKEMGKLPVRAGGGIAHIGQSILGAYRIAADMLVEDGATPYMVDDAMRDWGMPLGPYQALDIEGLETEWVYRRARAADGALAERHVAIGERLCEIGRTGRKAKKGYYAYEGDGQPGQPDPEVIDLIRTERERHGIVVQRFSPQDIQRRCLAAMANEGARLLRLGIAYRPSDIDVVMVTAYGFPRWRGGPMKAADLAGLLAVQRDIEHGAQHDPIFWTVEPLFRELVKNGLTFGDLDD